MDRKPGPEFDLVIKRVDGAKMFDSLSGKFVDAQDIAFADGAIAQIGGDIRVEATRVVRYLQPSDIVCPPITDIHTHYDPRSPWGHGMDPDVHGLFRGVPYQVDAGTAGMHGFPDFHENVLTSKRFRSPPRWAFMNIAPEGLAKEHGELKDLTYLNPEATAAMADKYRKHTVGMKERLAWLQTLQETWRPAHMATLKAAEMAKMPIMVHIADGPPVEEIIRELRPGDIVTHCFHGRGKDSSPRIIMENGDVKPEVLQAQRDGIIFDVGHGQGSFNRDTAARALDKGFLPNTISSDLHKGCRDGPTYDLLRTMSKLHSLGVQLPDVLRCVTRNAIAAIRQPANMGHLEVGSPADCSVVELIELPGGIPFVDADNNTWRGKVLIQNSFVVRNGVAI